MKECVRRLFRLFADARFVAGLGGVLLSVAAHELFHVIVHWGEINSIHFFPDAQAIVEIIFTPSTEYDLVIEEAIAYTITMVTLVLTAMLVGDIHDAMSSKTVRETIFSNDVIGQYDSKESEKQALEHLRSLLGISSTTQV